MTPCTSALGRILMVEDGHERKFGDGVAPLSSGPQSCRINNVQVQGRCATLYRAAPPLQRLVRAHFAKEDCVSHGIPPELECGDACHSEGC